MVNAALTGDEYADLTLPQDARKDPNNQPPTSAPARAIVCFTEEPRLLVGNVLAREDDNANINQVTVKVDTHDCPTIDAYLSLKFGIPTTDGTAERRIARVMEQRFFSGNLDSDIRMVKLVDLDDAARANILAPFQPTPELSRLVKKGGYIVLEIPYNASVPYDMNVFNTRSYGAADQVVNELRVQLSKPQLVLALVRASDISAIIRDLNTSIASQRETHPALGFVSENIKSMSGFVLQTGMFRPAESRPRPAPRPSLSYPEFYLYATTLGIASLQDMEYAMTLGEVVRGAQARIIEVNGYGDRAFLALLDLPKDSSRLQPGSRVRVNFDNSPVDISINWWPGVVLPPLPYQDLVDTPVFIFRPRCEPSVGVTETESDFMKFEPEITAVAAIKNITDGASGRSLLRNASPRLCDVKCTVSDKAHRNQIVALNELVQNHGLRLMRALLACVNFGALPRLDMYRNVDDPASMTRTLNRLCLHFRLNTQQAAAVRLTRDALGGLMCLTGAPGTGKTTTALTSTAGAYLAKKGGRPGRSLILTPTNTMADHTVRSVFDKIQGLTGELKPDRAPVILRGYTQQIDKSIALMNAQDKRAKRAPYLDPEDRAALEDCSQVALSMVRNIDKNITNPVKGVRDARVRHDMLGYSMGMLIGKVAGIAGPHDPLYVRLSSEPGWPEKDLQAFMTSYEAYMDGEKFDSDRSGKFTEVISRIKAYLYAHVIDIVVATYAAAGQTDIRTNFQPLLIYCAEAGRITDAELWPILAYYRFDFLLKDGDTKQIRPVVPSLSGGMNNFGRSLRITLLCRLEACGADVVKLDLNNRFNRDIADIVQLSYDKHQPMQLSPATLNRPDDVRFRKFAREEYGIDRNAILLEVAGAVCDSIPGLTSRFNETTILVIANVLLRMHARSIRMAEIAVITPYQAQYEILIRAIEELSSKVPGVDWSAIYVSKFDTMQGEERPFVVMDLTRHDEVGFLSDGNRINAGCSRAQNGLVVVLPKGLDSGKSYRRLDQVITHMKLARLTYQLDPTAVEDMRVTLSEVLPSAGTDRAAAAAAVAESVGGWSEPTHLDDQPDGTQQVNNWEDGTQQVDNWEDGPQQNDNWEEAHHQHDDRQGGPQESTGPSSPPAAHPHRAGTAPNGPRDIEDYARCLQLSEELYPDGFDNTSNNEGGQASNAANPLALHHRSGRGSLIDDTPLNVAAGSHPAPSNSPARVPLSARNQGRDARQFIRAAPSADTASPADGRLPVPLPDNPPATGAGPASRFVPPTTPASTVQENAACQSDRRPSAPAGTKSPADNDGHTPSQAVGPDPGANTTCLANAPVSTPRLVNPPATGARSAPWFVNHNGPTTSLTPMSVSSRRGNNGSGEWEAAPDDSDIDWNQRTRGGRRRLRNDELVSEADEEEEDDYDSGRSVEY